MTKILLLKLHLYGLESALMPLLDGDTHPELAQSLHCLHELLQSVVASSIKLAVLEEFINGFLLAADEHVLQQGEGDLGDEQFVMVLVVTVHLGALPADLNHAVVVGAVQLFQLALQLVPLLRQTVDHSLDVIDLVVILKSISVQILNLIFEHSDTFVSLVLLLLHLLAKG